MKREAASHVVRTLFPAVLCRNLVALAVTCLAACGSASRPHSLVGVWSGTLERGAAPSTLFFEVSVNPEGRLIAVLDVPAQHVFGETLDTVTVSGRDVVMGWTLFALKFTGRFSSNGKTIRGVWTAGRFTSSLVLHPGSKPERPRLAQDPIPPFPYDVADVRYKSPRAGIWIGGTLTKPHSATPVAAVVLAAASGLDRDNSAGPGKPFLVLADYLTRRGLAILRIDSRGVGQSGGNWETSTTADVADDVVAGVAFLKRQPGIDPGRIGAAGASEGAAIAAIAAERSPDIKFIVMMVPMGIPGAEDGVLLREKTDRAAGKSDTFIAFGSKLQRQMFHIILTTQDDALATQKLDELWETTLAGISHTGLTAAEQQGFREADTAYRDRVRRMTSPWERFILSYDPSSTLRDVHCQVLIVAGSADLRASPKENLPPIAAALRTAGNQDVTIRELPGLTHNLQTATSGVLSEETVSPAVLSTIGDWLVTHATARMPTSQP